MKQIGIIGLGLVSGLLLMAQTGCDVVDTSEPEFASALTTQSRDGASPGGLSKAYVQGDFYTTAIYDPDGNEYRATYNSANSGYDAGVDRTTFSYDVEVGNASGFHFALQVPECSYERFYGSEPAGNWNGNANGSLEFGPEDFRVNPTTVSYTFEGEVALGVVSASFKYGGAGDDPLSGAILGPCQKVDYWITGTVFLDDPGNAAGVLGVQDGNEPGIGGVEVALFEADGSTPNEGEPTQLTGADGSYAFHVVGPPIFDPHYRVEILASGGGLNAKLLNPNGVFKTSDSVVRDVDLNVSSTAAGIGFWLDITRAIEVFEDPALSETDMLPREFWRVQVTGKGTSKYKPVVPLETLHEYIGTVAAFSGHIPYVFPEGVTLETAADILKTESKNNSQEYLRTLTLAALFNFAADRGTCATLDLVEPPEGSPIGFLVCAQPDAESTRLIIEQALIEWMRFEGLTMGKESGGSMSRVLSAMM